MRRAAFITAALNAGVPLGDVQIARPSCGSPHDDHLRPARQDFDRHAAYVVVAFAPVVDRRSAQIPRYDTRLLEIYSSARKHGIADDDIVHAVEYALATGEQDDAKVLYLGPDRAGNLLEVVSVAREDGTEIVIHAMRMRAKYEPFFRSEGDDHA